MKYMVLVPNDPPEYIEADSYRVDDLRVLHLYTGDRESASFVNWLGVKEVGPSTDDRAKVKPDTTRTWDKPMPTTPRPRPAPVR